VIAGEANAVAFSEDHPSICKVKVWRGGSALWAAGLQVEELPESLEGIFPGAACGKRE